MMSCATIAEVRKVEAARPLVFMRFISGNLLHKSRQKCHHNTRLVSSVLLHYNEKSTALELGFHLFRLFKNGALSALLR